MAGRRNSRRYRRAAMPQRGASRTAGLPAASDRESRFATRFRNFVGIHFCEVDRTSKRMSVSEEFLQREYRRVSLFGETWRDLIPAVFRDVPAYYDKGNAVASLGSFGRWSDAFATAVHRRLPRGARVLDVASGTHSLPLRLLACDPTLRIDAVDASEHMIAEGQRRARERNLTIHARVCDAHELPFDDASFDAVRCSSPHAILSSSRRFAKSAGCSSPAAYSVTTTCCVPRRASSSCPT